MVRQIICINEEKRNGCGLRAKACHESAIAMVDGKAKLIRDDNVNYTSKLTEILRNNDIKRVTVLRMEVPCCGGLELAVRNALKESGKFIPWQVVTVSIDGKILDESE